MHNVLRCFVGISCVHYGTIIALFLHGYVTVGRRAAREFRIMSTSNNCRGTVACFHIITGIKISEPNAHLVPFVHSDILIFAAAANELRKRNHN